jgi:hypothetical protein
LTGLAGRLESTMKIGRWPVHHEEEVRLIAYWIWEDEGRPHGCDLDHWLRAEAVWHERQISVAPPVAEKPEASTVKPRAKKSGVQRRRPKP